MTPNQRKIHAILWGIIIILVLSIGFLALKKAKEMEPSPARPSGSVIESADCYFFPFGKWQEL